MTLTKAINEIKELYEDVKREERAGSQLQCTLVLADVLDILDEVRGSPLDEALNMGDGSYRP